MCFAPRPSERSKTLQLGPQFADKPLERNWTLQLGPWPRGTAGSPEFRRLRPRSRAGGGSGSSRGSPRTYWWPGLGQGCRWRGSSTGAGGGGRVGAVSGEETARGGQCATLGGALGPREDARGAGWKGDGRRRQRSGSGGNGAARRGWRLGMAWGRREHGALLYARARVTAG
jgi:hypothetical protein